MLDGNKAWLEMIHNMDITKEPPPRFFDTWFSLCDVYYQMTIPQLEYERSDVRPYDCIGMVRTVAVPDRSLPPWWTDVLLARREGKKVIAVTQSSVEFDLGCVVKPTLEALKNRDDLLVVAALVNYEPEQYEAPVPANTRIAKFIPLDILLPFVSMFLSIRARTSC